jgi:hypothetical protein
MIELPVKAKMRGYEKSELIMLMLMRLMLAIHVPGYHMC